MMMLILSVDKRIHIDVVGKIFIAPCVGSVVMSICCVGLKHCFDNLWLKTLLCVMSGVVVYGIVQLIMKNDIVVEFCKKWLKLIGRKSR